MTDAKACTPGYEWMCATARSQECHCQCGGKNHGKYRHLITVRATSTAPWTTTYARRVLRDAQAARAKAGLR